MRTTAGKIYELRGVRVVEGDPGEVEQCSLDEAEMFGVYARPFVGGAAAWLADFAFVQDAALFLAVREIHQ